MTKFKVGDRVKLINIHNSPNPNLISGTGTIHKIYTSILNREKSINYICVLFDNQQVNRLANFYELELEFSEDHINRELIKEMMGVK